MSVSGTDTVVWRGTGVAALGGTHANHAHGLAADQSRQAFGLMQKTPLAGPTYREKRRQFVDHLLPLDNPNHDWTIPTMNGFVT